MILLKKKKKKTEGTIGRGYTRDYVLWLYLSKRSDVKYVELKKIILPSTTSLFIINHDPWIKKKISTDLSYFLIRIFEKEFINNFVKMYIDNIRQEKFLLLYNAKKFLKAW